MTQKDAWRTLAVCLALVLGTLGLYAQAFTFSFVNSDELLSNPHLKKGLGDTLAWAIQPGNGLIWQPLAWVSHELDYMVYGFKPAGHHATSLILHALNSALVFLVLRQLTGAFWRSAFVAAFFAWHPLHVEAAASVAHRSALLCAFFCLLTLWAYAGYANNLKFQISNFKLLYVLAVVAFALALMSNPMAVTLPLVLLLLDWWPLARMAATPERTAGRQAWVLLLEKTPFLVLSAASIVVSFMALARISSLEQIAVLPFRLRFVNAGMTCFHFLAKSFWPSDLAASYPVVLHWPKWALVSAGLILTLITVVAVRARPTRPFWLAGWLWFLFTLLPVLNLLQPGWQFMADRYMYLPSVGLWMLVCWEVCDLTALYRLGRVVGIGLCAVLLAACGVFSFLQIGVWKDEGTLLARIPESDSNAPAHAEYANFLLRTGQLPQAQAECEKAISISTNAPLLEVLLGDILLAKGKPDEATQKFQLALRLYPKANAARLGLGRADMLKKQTAEAVQEFKLVTFNEPKNIEAHNLLARALLVQGKTAEAVQEFNASLNLQLNQPITLNELAWLLATDPRPEIRKGPDAVKMADRACVLTKGLEPSFIGTLSAAFAETGDFAKAVKYAQLAHDLAAQEKRTALAEEDAKMLALFKDHKPYRQKQ